MKRQRLLSRRWVDHFSPHDKYMCVILSLRLFFYDCLGGSPCHVGFICSAVLPSSEKYFVNRIIGGHKGILNGLPEPCRSNGSRENDFRLKLGPRTSSNCHLRLPYGSPQVKSDFFSRCHLLIDDAAKLSFSISFMRLHENLLHYFCSNFPVPINFDNC